MLRIQEEALLRVWRWFRTRAAHYDDDVEEEQSSGVECVE